MLGRVTVVVGGQFGSEGKGAICGALAKRCVGFLLGMRVAGPNAGHSVVDAVTGKVWALRQIPVAAVANRYAELAVAAGSEINEEVLAAEVKQLNEAGFGVSERLHVDSTATVITQDHIVREIGLVGKIGSTGKGVGAARASRIMREAAIWGGKPSDTHPELAMPWGTDTVKLALDYLERGREVQIEGTQGFGLGLHAGYYPKCTSSDCRWFDFAAMAGIPCQGHSVDVWVVLRTYPIRVAGASGPLTQETSWSALSDQSGGYIQPEYTTVTHKERRVGGWDPALAKRAVVANGTDVNVALTFFDYWFPKLAEAADRADLADEHLDRVDAVEHQVGAKVRYLGTGRNTGIWL